MESIHIARIWTESRGAKPDGAGAVELPRLLDQLPNADHCVNVLGDVEENQGHWK